MQKLFAGKSASCREHFKTNFSIEMPLFVIFVNVLDKNHKCPFIIHESDMEFGFETPLELRKQLSSGVCGGISDDILVFQPTLFL
jgi:hypothetical protein